MSLHFKNNLEQVKKELSASLEYHEKALEVWKTVTIKKKKDGSEYQHLSRALENASEVFEYNSFNRIKIYFRTESTGYQDDYINIYGYLDELPDEDERKKEYVPQILRQKYIFSADEIRTAIRQQIKYHEEEAASLKKQIENAEKAYADFHEGLSVLLKELEKNTFCEHKDFYSNGKPAYDSYINHTTLYYDILEQY